MECDLKIVPYNLQMILDWGSHLNIEYSGSAYCALYMYKYCYKGAAKKECVLLFLGLLVRFLGLLLKRPLMSSFYSKLG